jgi:glycosyltransferase involved in cell wall biosynthesis
MQENNDNNSLISIILPVYNGEKYLGQAIESCINQTYKNLELIVVNDNSTDNTLTIIKFYAQKDDRIKIINNEVNKKLPASLNIGHKLAKGDYITWTSHDNILKSNFLECLFTTLINNDADIVFSNYDIIWEEGRFKRVHIPGPVEHLIYGIQIGASFLYKKKVFQELNGYDIKLFLLEDYDFWIRASFKFKFFHLRENLYQYRLNPFSLTSKIQNDKNFNENYQYGITLMFSRIANELGWNEITKNMLINNYFNKSISISDYFLNKGIIKSDVLKIKNNKLDGEQIIYGLFFILRSNLMNNRLNFNLKTLIKIIKFEKKILFHKSFSKKATINYIKNSIL